MSYANSSCNWVINLFFYSMSNLDENFDEIQFYSNSCSYVTCDEFNSLLPPSEGLSTFHLNISSISKHYDNLLTLLSQLNINFNIIGISESQNALMRKILLLLQRRNKIFPYPIIKNSLPQLNPLPEESPCMTQNPSYQHLGKT
mgnify:CR=1 FL=1